MVAFQVFCLMLRYLQVDVSQLKVYYMLDDGGSYIISAVNSQIKHAISKVRIKYRNI